MIDLRSDTVTQPTEGMRKAMASAAVGDDVFGDDPTVNQLERRVADLIGKESAMLVSSGTQSNLCALLTHCARGEEYIVGQDYHTYLYEAGGAASLGGIQSQPVSVELDGSLNLEKVESVIKPDDYHFAITKLLALENTHSGKVISNAYLSQALALADKHQLSTHLDGARLMNAAVSQNISAAEIAKGFDSVSICFSKGLGAPVGSVLCGSKAFISRARRWRKMLGGGMRQAGVIAAAIDYALDNNVERLVEDHTNASLLESKLKSVPGLKVEHANTNMLYIEFPSKNIGKQIAQKLKSHNILILGGKKVRLVTHLGITRESVKAFVGRLQKLMQN